MYTLKEARKYSHVEDSDTLVIAVDLQQAFPTSYLATESVFYSHQLWINLLNGLTATICVWAECKAGRGSDEIGSCLFRVCMEK
jgi:hypothetical protein